VSLTVAAADAPLALAEASEVLGAGCRERALPGGRVALDFWLPAPAPGRVDETRERLQRAGIVAGVEEATEGNQWQEALRAFHRPVEIAGRILVRPPWEPARPGLADVVIDPGMAFGTGQHATTRSCLELLADLPPGSLLDVGCGSGILAIAARRLGHDPVWAVDADPLAVEATIANARTNGVGITVARRTVGRDRLPPARHVIGNLTATVMPQLAQELAAAPPEGAILSGLRPAEAPGVLGAFAPLGLREAARIDRDGWTTLLVAR
jgi:ribosomal protein L11 methyltransferase